MSEPKVMFVAGEASGDHHAAAVAVELLARRPGLRLFGLGGGAMAAAGVDLRLDLASKGVIGLVEVIKHLAFFRRAFNLAVGLLESEKPDLLVLVDYPGFNLRLAAKARERGIKIAYFISPQVWAWKAGRVPMMARTLDRMLVTFPFEKEIYDQAGLRCSFVGNPLVDAVSPSLGKAEFRASKGWRDEKVVGLLPGSRDQEVKWLLPVMLRCAGRIAEKRPGTRFVVVKSPTLPRSLYEKLMQGAPAELYEWSDPQEAYAMRAACDFALVASGTATLETAILKVPFVLLYRINPLTFEIGKRLVKIHSIGLANVVAGRRVVPEFLQKLDDREISATALDFLDHPERGRAQVEELAPSLRGLGEPGVPGRVAGELLEMLP